MNIMLLGDVGGKSFLPIIKFIAEAPITKNRLKSESINVYLK